MHQMITLQDRPDYTMFMLPISLHSVRQLQHLSCTITPFVRNFNSGPETSKSNGILAEYHRMVAAGKLQPDITQLAAAQALQLLQDSLAITAAEAAVHNAAGPLPSNPAAVATDTADRREPAHSIKPTALSEDPTAAVHRAPGASDTAAAAAVSSNSPGIPRVQGAYLWGPVGSGKTMLMDMFLKTLPQVQVPADGGSTSTAEDSSYGKTSSTASSSAQVAVQEVQINAHRVHYHEFMLAVHEQLHHMQQSLPKIVSFSRAGLPVYRYALPPEDPLLAIARDAAAGIHLLCLDELHVTDVADAMLLSRLFGELLCQGCTVMFTSNRPARDLYKGGLSRKYFEPFIKLIDDRLLQLKVAGGKDYRSQVAQQATKQQGSSPYAQQQLQQQIAERGPLAAVAANSGAWYVGQGAGQQLQQQWQQLQQQLSELHAALGAAADCDTHAGPVRIALPFGRSLWIPQALFSPQITHHNSSMPQQQQQYSTAQQEQQQQQQHIAAAYFTFEQICGSTGCRQSLEHAGVLSATDHLALVRACPAIFIDGVPQLTPQQRDEARRLVTLVDILYEAHTTKAGSVKLFVSGDVLPEEVFLPLLGAAAAQGINPNLGKSEGKLNVQQLVQVYGSKLQAPAGRDEFGAAAGEVGSSSSSHRAMGSVARPAATAAASPELRSSLLPEEVLMYHRASSRLTELCAVVQT